MEWPSVINVVLACAAVASAAFAGWALRETREARITSQRPLFYVTLKTLPRYDSRQAPIDPQLAIVNVGENPADQVVVSSDTEILMKTDGKRLNDLNIAKEGYPQIPPGWKLTLLLHGSIALHWVVTDVEGDSLMISLSYRDQLTNRRYEQNVKVMHDTESRDTHLSPMVAAES